MKIPNKPYTTHTIFGDSNCTFLSSFSAKTLNPNNLGNTLSSHSVSAISSLCDSLSGSTLFFSSGSYPLQKRPILSISSSESRSLFIFGLRSSNCFSNLYLLFKNIFLINFSRWFSTKCKTESHLSYKDLPVCYFSSGRPPKIRYFTRSFLQSLGSLTHISYNVCSNSEWPHCGKMVRCYTISSSNRRFNSEPVVEGEILSVPSVANVSYKQLKLEERKFSPPKLVLEIVDILRNNGDDLESRLNMLHSGLSIYSIREIFEVLNSQSISGLRFFEWIRRKNPQLHRSAYICSLIIDNIGRLDDYETMYAWFKKFTSEKICLTYEAFRFLPVLVSTDSSMKESTKTVVDLLNRVGGSCRSSGVCALIEMFCKVHLFEMARYVIKITESKNSYYCLLIREKCKNGLIEDACNIIKEMRQANCAPDTTVYNYLLGSLWKNGRMDEASVLLDEMKENGVPSGEITFEILINSACSIGNMDIVHQLLEQMVSQGLVPRPSTHACIIKSLFAAEKYETAYKYVIDSSIIYKTCSNMMYSLMANLYREKGDIISACNTLVEMMENDLKPNFSIYIKIVKQLRRAGKANLARDLEIRHSKFMIKSHPGLP